MKRDLFDICGLITLVVLLVVSTVVNTGRELDTESNNFVIENLPRLLMTNNEMTPKEQSLYFINNVEYQNFRNLRDWVEDNQGIMQDDLIGGSILRIKFSSGLPEVVSQAVYTVELADKKQTSRKIGDFVVVLERQENNSYVFSNISLNKS